MYGTWSLMALALPVLLVQAMHVRVLHVRERALTLRFILTSVFACTPAIRFS